MTSKFWDADDVSLSDLSDSSSSCSSKNLPKTETKSQPTTNKWANLEDTSSDEEEKRIVRSAKEKQWNQIRQTIKTMNNYKNIDDFSQLNTSLDNLMKSVKKILTLNDKEEVPKFLLQTLVDLEEYLTEKNSNKDEIKKLTKTKSINFYTLKSKLRKYIEELRPLIDEFKQNPESFGNDCEELSNSSQSVVQSENESSSSNNSPNDSSFSDDTLLSSSESDLESEKESDSESSNWSDDVPEQKTDKNATSETAQLERGLKVWGKRPENKSTKLVPKEKKKQIIKPKSKTQISVEASVQKAKYKASMTIFSPDEKIDAKLINRKLRELNVLRKRKGFDHLEQIKYLQEITEVAQSVSPQSYIEALNYFIGAYFDSNPGIFSSLNYTQWNHIYTQINAAITTLRSYKDTYFPILAFEDDVIGTQISELDQNSIQLIMNPSSKNLNEEDQLAAKGHILNNDDLKANTALVLTTYLERLDNELYKALQLADLHSNEYRMRLSQVVDILTVLWKAYNYLLSIDQKCARILSLSILNHMYYRNEELGRTMWKLVRERLDEQDRGILENEEISSKEIIKLLVQDVLQDENNVNSKVSAILSYAYQLSIDGNFYEAKDLLQTTNIHDLAMQCNIATQILYNRNLVQLGLAAFSLGLTNEAHSYLSEICNMGKYKELLAQGLSNLPKGLEKSAEQDRLEKQRLLPYHMHIASELVETVHNICAMLIEIPYMTQNPLESYRKPLTRNFRRQLELYERQVFTGPPESSKEIVLAASKALQKGDWKLCCEILSSLSIWSSFKNPNLVKDIIFKKVQEEALKIYLFRYSTLYDAYDVNQLAEMFNLTVSITHSIVSKLLIQNKLEGSWDGAAKCVLINRVDRSIMQMYALQLSEKINLSLEQNELFMAHKTSKSMLTQNLQKDERAKKLDERRVNFYSKGEWSDNKMKWDNFNVLDGRRVKFTQFTVTTFDKNDQRRKKR